MWIVLEGYKILRTDVDHILEKRGDFIQIKEIRYSNVTSEKY